MRRKFLFFALLSLISLSTIGQEYDFLYKGNTVPDDWQNDLMVNADFKELSIGESHEIWARRVIEIIDNPISNRVLMPKFNYEVVSGNSISVDENGVVTANSLGVSIIKITYQATTAYNKEYAAISPINVSYFIADVVDNKNSGIEITPNISLRSYDTYYFIEGDHRIYNFTPTATSEAEIVVKCNNIAIDKKTDKSYDLPLKNRANIIEISATKNGKTEKHFQVVDARKIELNIKNLNRNNGRYLQGDKVQISFKGIIVPVPKLATIYNPHMGGWGGEKAHVLYTCEGLSNVKSNVKLTQYHLATNNTIELTLPEVKTYEFRKGRIKEFWYGQPLGTDKKYKGGFPNAPGYAPTQSDEFISMPDFDIIVAPDPAIEVEILGVPEGIQCNGRKIKLTAKSNLNGVSYLWDDSTTNSSITVTKTGTYKVIVKKDGKSISTSATINFSDAINANLEIIGDDILCSNRTATLSAPDVENGNFVWNTNETTKTITINKSGNYWVEVSKDTKCQRVEKKVNNSPSPIQAIYANAYESYTWRGNTYSKTGIYHQYKPNGNGKCDSIFMLYLTVLPKSKIDSSYLTVENGFKAEKVNANLSLPFVVGNKIYGFDNKAISCYNMITKNIEFTYPLNDDAYTPYPSFVTVSADEKTAWVGFTVGGNTDDRIYSLDLETGKWTKKGTIAGNQHLVFWGEHLLVSALGSSNWKDPNSVWLFDTEKGTFRKIIEMDGNSADINVDKYKRLTYASYKSKKLYRWSAKKIKDVIKNKNANPLSYADADMLSDLNNGANGIVTDANSNIFVTTNKVGGKPTLNYHTSFSGMIKMAEGGSWLGRLSAIGSLSNYSKNDAIYVSDFSKGIAKITREAMPVSTIYLKKVRQQITIDNLFALFTSSEADQNAQTIKSFSVKSSNQKVALAREDYQTKKYYIQTYGYNTGATTITFSARYRDMKVSRSFDVVVYEDTIPLQILQAIEDVYCKENDNKKIIDISKVFLNYENPEAKFSVSVKSNDNSSVVKVIVNKDNKLEIVPIPNQSGVANIVVEGMSDGKTVSDEFLVTVTENKAPTVINPIADIEVKENAAPMNIDLANVFDDVDNDNNLITKQITANTNQELVQTNIDGNLLTLTFSKDKSGVATITVTATSNGKTVSDEFLVTVTENKAPTVINPIADIEVKENAAPMNIDLANVFDDVDNDNNLITKQITANTNQELVQTNIDGNLLTLTFSKDKSGVATITITATSNGKTVSDEFLVTVTGTVGMASVLPNSISIYPNPTDGKTVVRIGNNNIVDIECYNAFGKAVLKLKNCRNEQEIDLTDFSSGLYFVRILVNEKLINIYKVIKK